MKRKKDKICGRVLKVENYGAGVRWCCEKCDYHPWGTPGSRLPSYSWTHSPVPKPATCRRREDS